MRELRAEVVGHMDASVASASSAAASPDTDAAATSPDTAFSSSSSAAAAAAASRNASTQHGVGSCVAMHVRRADI